jgi:hypothetical protein
MVWWLSEKFSAIKATIWERWRTIFSPFFGWLKWKGEKKKFINGLSQVNTCHVLTTLNLLLRMSCFFPQTNNKLFRHVSEVLLKGRKVIELSYAAKPWPRTLPHVLHMILIISWISKSLSNYFSCSFGFYDFLLAFQRRFCGHLSCPLKWN